MSHSSILQKMFSKNKKKCYDTCKSKSEETRTTLKPPQGDFYESYEKNHESSETTNLYQNNQADNRDLKLNIDNGERKIKRWKSHQERSNCNNSSLMAGDNRLVLSDPKIITWRNKDAYVYTVDPSYEQGNKPDLEFVIYIPIDTAVQWLDAADWAKGGKDGDDGRNKLGGGKDREGRTNPGDGKDGNNQGDGENRGGRTKPGDGKDGNNQGNGEDRGGRNVPGEGRDGGDTRNKPYDAKPGGTRNKPGADNDSTQSSDESDGDPEWPAIENLRPKIKETDSNMEFDKRDKKPQKKQLNKSDYDDEDDDDDDRSNVGKEKTKPGQKPGQGKDKPAKSDEGDKEKEKKPRKKRDKKKIERSEEEEGSDEEETQSKRRGKHPKRKNEPDNYWNENFSDSSYGPTDIYLAKKKLSVNENQTMRAHDVDFQHKIHKVKR